MFKYLRWVPNYLALFRLIHQSRRRCRQVRVPCLCFQSGRDELVARSGAKYLADNPCIAVHWLERSGHFWYADKEKARLCERFAAFCRSC